MTKGIIASALTILVAAANRLGNGKEASLATADLLFYAGATDGKTLDEMRAEAVAAYQRDVQAQAQGVTVQ